MSSLSEFEIIKRLGEGSFGSVYQVKRKSDEKIYAMKKVKMISLSTKEKENALNEVRILASINSKNIISYKDAFYDEKSSCLCIIMEFASKGDVLMQINEKKKKHTYFEEETVWKFAAEMLLGLKSLHDMKILHRDLKGANVFVAEDGSLKLGDLNVSKVQKRDFAYTQTGTPYYTSPEVWQNRPYDSKCDVWSLGCVLYEIVTLQPPFKGISMEDLYKKVLRGVFQPINLQRYSNELQKFIESCLKVNPKMRESVDELLTHKNILPHIDLDTIVQSELNKKKNDKIDLLQTIKLPYGNNLVGLNLRLPKPNYDILDEKVEEYEAEIKSEQIRLKKKVDSRPFSAAEPSQNIFKNNVHNKNFEQNENINPNKGRDNLNNNYKNNSPQQQGQRLQSAQPQQKRVLSNKDLLGPGNQGKHYMPPIQNNNYKKNYHYYNYQNQNYQQPKIAIHQQKDSAYHNPIQRINSHNDILSKNGEHVIGRRRRHPEVLGENNRNYINRPPSNNHHYEKAAPAVNKAKLQPLAPICPRIPHSPSVNNVLVHPKPFRNY